MLRCQEERAGVRAGGKLYFGSMRHMNGPRTELLRVGGLLVDAPALAALAHRCDPRLCRKARSCCAEHELWLDGSECRRIQVALPRMRRHVPALKWAAGGRDPFRRLGPDRFAVRRRENGLCAFAFRTDDGRVLCALHSAALAEGLRPERVKPLGCTLWPLCLSPSRPRELAVSPGAYRYPCNRRRPPGAGGLHEGVAAIVRGRFGEGFLRRLLSDLTTQEGGAG